MKHQSYQQGNLQEGPEDKMSVVRDLPVQRLVRWAEGCSSLGWADQRMSMETEFQESVEGLRQAENIHFQLDFKLRLKYF